MRTFDEVTRQPVETVRLSPREAAARAIRETQHRLADPYLREDSRALKVAELKHWRGKFMQETTKLK